MTNMEKAVQIAVRDIKHEALLSGVRWECCEGWSDLLDWLGIDSAEMKENVHYSLRRAAWTDGLPFCVFDDCSIEDSDGSIKTYRQLANAIRKELFSPKVEEEPEEMAITDEQVRRIKMLHFLIKRNQMDGEYEQYMHGSLVTIEKVMEILGIEAVI